MPYMLFFEWFGPIIELAGFINVITGFWLGYISPEVTLIVFVIAIGFGMLLSVIAVMLEELSFHIYSNPFYVVTLFLAALIDNFGYRQLNGYWRITAMIQIIRDRKPEWSDMKRNANWKKDNV